VPEPRLVATGLAKTWDAGGAAPVAAVRDASLAVTAGEAVVVTGPSGAGKTTLLSLLGGLLRPDAGRVVLDGVDLGAAPEAVLQRLRLERVGFVFQRGVLLASLSARENVALVPQAAGVPRAAALARADEWLARVGLAARARLRPAALSAGEAQRAALARALVMGPRVVLADEPTAHLDAETGASVVTALRDLARDGGAALVVVTNDERLAAIGDRVLTLRDGRLAARDRG
jgi:putative ABC transport system ATP-binding protein